MFWWYRLYYCIKCHLQLVLWKPLPQEIAGDSFHPLVTLTLGLATHAHTHWSFPSRVCTVPMKQSSAAMTSCYIWTMATCWSRFQHPLPIFLDSWLHFFQLSSFFLLFSFSLFSSTFPPALSSALSLTLPLSPQVWSSTTQTRSDTLPRFGLLWTWLWPLTLTTLSSSSNWPSEWHSPCCHRQSVLVCWILVCSCLIASLLHFFLFPHIITIIAMQIHHFSECLYHASLL